jgi:hypothetical protein
VRHRSGGRALRGLTGPRIMPPMAQPLLVSVEIRFVADEDPQHLADRIEEAVRMVVGRDSLEEFRWKAYPLEPEES